MKKTIGRPREFDPKSFLDIALGCFWLKGYQATSIADLMKASNLASASIYKLYPDKRAIFFAALDQYMAEGLGRMQQRIEQQPPAQALRETLDYCASLSVGKEGARGCFTIAAASELLPADEEVREKVRYMFIHIRDNLAIILNLGQQQGVFRQDNSAEVMAESIFMMLEGMRIYGKIGPDHQQLKLANDFIMSTVLLPVAEVGSA